MSLTRATAVAVLVLSLTCLAACRSSPSADSGEIIVAPPSTDAPYGSAPVETSPLPQTPEAAKAATSTEADSSAVDSASEDLNRVSKDTYVMDGMIGQVNGRAIYARTIFIDQVRDQLTQIGIQHPGMAFRIPAVNAISLRVNEVVQNALLLGEAEQDLNEQEQQGLAYMLTEHRQELLRLYGRGSAAVAERKLQQERGMSLDEAQEEYRSSLLVQRYLHQKLWPLINVTRRDIDRYYDEHPEQFNPPPKRVLRLIDARDPQAVEQITQALADGSKSFADLASSELNSFKPAEGGKMEIVGDSPLASEPLNQAIVKLAVGSHAGPVHDGQDTWFVYLESMDQSPAQSLKDAQVQIEQILREQQFRILSQRLREKVMTEGSYTPPDLMIARLYAIAEARYNTASLSSR